ncbi:MAG: helix-turn-helix transcriptional regulator [Clostridia bacterium]|nr:helix-turn-helix transcriptional regulator [Clostridia bacterium]
MLKRPPRRIEYVMLVMRSNTFFKSGDKTVYATPGTVFIYDKSTPHHFGANGEPFLHDWITFDLTDDERSEFSSLGLKLDEPVKISDVFTLSELIKIIQREKYSSSKNAMRTSNLYLQILLYKTAEQMSNTDMQKSGYCSELDQLRAKIYSSPSQKWTVKDLAEKMNLSVSYFQHLYKERFFVSPIADVINSRIEYAKYLLASTNYSVKAVADELDYPSDIQFIQQFKSVTGKTPKKYRNSKKN